MFKHFKSFKGLYQRWQW